MCVFVFSFVSSALKLPGTEADGGPEGARFVCNLAHTDRIPQGVHSWVLPCQLSPFKGAYRKIVSWFKQFDHPSHFFVIPTVLFRGLRFQSED